MTKPAKSQIEVYDKNATRLASEYELMNPIKIYAHILKYFAKGSTVLDIGCGSGRDVAWLLKNGYVAKGVEPSENMIKEAKLRHKDIEIIKDNLPALAAIQDKSVDHILLSGVFMHLPEDEHPAATKNLVRILKSGGRIILSYRKSRAIDAVESDGRAFYPIDSLRLKNMLAVLSCKAIFEESYDEGAKSWTTLVFERA